MSSATARRTGASRRGGRASTLAKSRCWRTRRTATVRARTSVKLISIGRAEVLALSGAMDAFGRSLREVPRSRTGLRSKLAPKGLATPPAVEPFPLLSQIVASSCARKN
jgi:hypothetical protein